VKLMKLIKKLLIPRNIFLFIAISVQLIFLVGVFIGFYDFFAFFYGGSIFVSIVVVLRLINNKSNPAYKIAWIIPIMLFPIFGGLFYI
jgi:cardiolipin synthase